MPKTVPVLGLVAAVVVPLVAAATFVGALTQRVDSIEERVSENRERTADVETLAQRVGSIEASVSEDREQAADVEALAQRVGSIEASVSEDREQAADVVALAQRVGSIEAWVSEDSHRREQAIDAFGMAPRRAGSAIGFSNSGPWGGWSDPRFCPQGYYVCGMKQRVEGNQGGDGDDTAMNAVAFYCCPLNPDADPNPNP